MGLHYYLYLVDSIEKIRLNSSRRIQRYVTGCKSRCYVFSLFDGTLYRRAVNQLIKYIERGPNYKSDEGEMKMMQSLIL